MLSAALRPVRYLTGLRALTAPARSACNRSYAMAGRRVVAHFVMAEFDDGFGWRYPAITSPMPHGIPFTSPDVKR
jgi:hypothetical protein